MSSTYSYSYLTSNVVIKNVGGVGLCWYGGTPRLHITCELLIITILVFVVVHTYIHTLIAASFPQNRRRRAWSFVSSPSTTIPRKKR